MRRLGLAAGLIGFCTILWAGPDDGTAPPKAAGKPWSERDGRKVAVKPEGPKLSIPEGWVEWQTKFKNAIHASRPELEAVRDGAGEWDTEFAKVANACLDFDACAFAGGDDGWGKDSCAYSDLQMRLYVVDAAPEELEKKFDDAGAKAVAAVMSGQAGEEGAPKEGGKADPAKFKPTHDVAGGWRRTLFKFDLFYGDYGATAMVDIRLKAFGARTVAAVFMYTNFQDQSGPISAVTDTIQWPDSPPAKKEEK